MDQDGDLILMDTSGVKECLVLHGGALGDCVLTLHVCAAVRQSFPGSQITLSARSPIARFATGSKAVDRAIDPDALGLLCFFGEAAIPAEVIGKFSAYDLVISFLANADAPVTRRLHEHISAPVLPVDPAPRHNGPAVHITQQWFQTLGTLGLRLRKSSGQLLDSTAAEVRAARDSLRRLAGGQSGPLVICHPGSGGRAKCCPLEVLESAAQDLCCQGHAFVWMIGPTEMEWHGQTLVDRLTRTAPVIFEESLPEAAALIGGADAYIGNDAGMTHLAAALGVRTVALFGPTPAEVWRPLGDQVNVLRFDGPGDNATLSDQIATATR